MIVSAPCRAHHKDAEPAVAGSPKSSDWIGGYAAVLLKFLDCALTSGLTATFFAALSVSFAANSRLTVAAMVSVSTL